MKAIYVSYSKKWIDNVCLHVTNNNNNLKALKKKKS